MSAMEVDYSSEKKALKDATAKKGLLDLLVREPRSKERRYRVLQDDERARDEYRSLLERSAGLHPSPLLNSSSPLQFVTAARYMFERATKRVCVFSDCLSQYSEPSRYGGEENCIHKIWAGLGPAAREFLRRDGSRLDILIRGLLDTPTDPELHELLREAISDKDRKGTISLRVARDKLVPWRDLFQWNFMAVDARDIRYEVDGGSTHALLQFNNCELGEKFERMFDRMADAIDTNGKGRGCAKLMALRYGPDDKIPAEGRCVNGGNPPYLWVDFVQKKSPEPDRSAA